MTAAASVDDLRPGDHACLTCSDAEERLDIVAVYYEDPLPRICRQHAPPGIRLAGEID
jgi:hypothetical protein